jgi:NADPH:quinone reductase-like Zn-dependent oxidoreductase
MSVIPTKMRALLLVKLVEKFDAEDLASCFEVREVDVPVPQSGEVLVKIECSPINPSDLATLQGTYNSAQRQPLPSTAGFEGSGTVIASGGGLMAWMVMGKRVGISAGKIGAMWSEYAVVPAVQCVVLPDSVSFEQGCACFVNPLTAVAFLEIAKSRGQKAIVHTAGASSLGKMLVRHAKTEGIDVVCVVRRQEQVRMLEEIGATHIITTSDSDWQAKLTAICKEKNVQVGFEAVAGVHTGEVLQCMLPGSELFVYGALSNESCSGISPSDLIFKRKKVSGFWLSEYLRTKSLLGKKSMVDKVAASLATTLGAKVRVSYPLEKASEAFKDYVKNMSNDKEKIKANSIVKTESHQFSLLFSHERFERNFIVAHVLQVILNCLTCFVQWK